MSTTNDALANNDKFDRLPPDWRAGEVNALAATENSDWIPADGAYVLIYSCDVDPLAAIKVQAKLSGGVEVDIAEVTGIHVRLNTGSNPVLFGFLLHALPSEFRFRSASGGAATVNIKYELHKMPVVRGG